MWEQGSAFIKKAGTIIFGVVVIIWVLSNLPVGVEYASQHSIIGRIGSFLALIFKPVGFGTWEADASLIFGLLSGQRGYRSDTRCALWSWKGRINASD
jgi:ferrous iron transport protein B